MVPAESVVEQASLMFEKGSWAQSTRMKNILAERGIVNIMGNTQSYRTISLHALRETRVRSDVQIRCAKRPHLRRDLKETESPFRPEYIDVATCAPVPPTAPTTDPQERMNQENVVQTEQQVKAT